MQEEVDKSRPLLLWRLALAAHIVLLGVVLAMAYTHNLPAFIGRTISDDVGHFVLIGLLSLLAHRAFNRPMIQVTTDLALPLAPLAVAALASFEEAVQILSPNRSQSLTDLAADMIGIIFFLALDKIVQLVRSYAD